MEAAFQRSELADVLHHLDNPDRRGVFVLGDPGVGKTVLARILEDRGWNGTRLASLVLASAAMNDVVAWCLLAVVLALAGATSGGEEVVSETTVYTGPELPVPIGSTVTVWAGTPHERTSRVITATHHDHPSAWSHLEIALT